VERAIIASTSNIQEGRVYQKIIMVAAVTFIILPFVTTFNEFLTKVVESINVVSTIQGVVAPFVVRIVAAILLVLRIPISIDGSYIYLTSGYMPLRIYINWNCVGWQSFVLLAFTFVTGLQGPYRRRSKLIAVLIGLEGTFLVNVIRILVPTLLAYNYGYLAAVVFHDYLGTVITLLWMGTFWGYAFNDILIRPSELIEGGKSSIASNSNEVKV
jgi:exosortase/archaeosortase family protein